MKNHISLAQAQAHLPDLVEEVVEKGRRKVITRNGKPAVIVSPAKRTSRRKRPQTPKPKKNLVEAMGNWRSDELYESIMEAHRIMRSEKPRPVHKLDE